MSTISIMCMFSAPVAPVPQGTPTKSSLDVQREAEDARLRLGFTRNSFASTILTGGFGGTSGAGVRGTTLGV